MRKYPLIFRKRFGVLLRVFAKTPDLVDKNVIQTIQAAQAAFDVYLEGRPLFAKVMVLVVADPDYPDCDCGLTKAAVERAAADAGLDLEVHEIRKGDIFCASLGYGIGKMLRHGVDYTTILSHGVKDYVTDDVMGQTVELLQKGAKVVGVAINELKESVLAGEPANTFATWDNLALVTASAFDRDAAQPRKDDTSGRQGGVEEIIPAFRIAEVYGRCIGAVVPENAGEWKKPTDPDGVAREEQKMKSKRARKEARAAAIGRNLDDLKDYLLTA